MRKSLCLFLLPLAVACGTETPDGQDKPPPPPPASGPTYYADVVPILEAHCVGCHGADGIAPFGLTDFASVQVHADAALSAVQAGRMPPRPFDPANTCNKNVITAPVPAADVQMLADWIAGGMIEGDPDSTPPRSSDELTGNVTHVTTGLGDIASANEYRCFLVDPRRTSDSFLTGFDLTPVDRAAVHDARLFMIMAESAEQELRALDGADGRPGWACDGWAYRSTFPIGAWTPNDEVFRYPAGQGLRLVGDRPLAMLVHFDAARDAAIDVSLELETQVTQEAFVAAISVNGEWSLPPGQANATVSDSIPLQGMTDLGLSSVMLSGMLPYTFDRGRSVKVEHSSKGCISDFDGHEFVWPAMHQLTAPVELRPEDSIDITCTFDTTNETQPIGPGGNTAGEMCAAALLMTSPDFDYPKYAAVYEDQPGGSPSDELTFLIVNELNLIAFGSSAEIVGLFNSDLAGALVPEDPTTVPQTLVSLPGETTSSTFPIRSDARGGTAVYDAPSQRWQYVGPSGELSIPGFNIGAGGEVALASPVSLRVNLGPLPIALSKTQITGRVRDSGSIRGIEALRLDGCIAEVDFRELVSLLGMTGQFLALFATQDCDLDGDGAFDAYRFEATTEPIAVGIIE